MKKVLNRIVDILIILLFIVSLFVVAMALTSPSTGIPNIAGITLFSVQTDSMEPTIMTGDLLISRVCDQNDTHEIGEVVTFRAVVDRSLIFNTHRIVDIRDINGTTYYITQGDNAIGRDQKELSAGDIVAKWNGTKLNGAGKVMDYLQTRQGFFLCVLLPTILFSLYLFYQFIANLIAYNKEKAVDAAREITSELTEEQKKKAIEEYLAAQAKAKDESDSADP